MTMQLRSIGTENTKETNIPLPSKYCCLENILENKQYNKKLTKLLTKCCKILKSKEKGISFLYYSKY